MAATLKQLRVLVALAEEGGFAAAGDVLGMGQSSVSHTLAALERHVGSALVSRSPVALTPVGTRLLPHARAALAGAAAFEAATAAAVTREGTLTLAITPTAGCRVVPRLLAHWRAQAPAIRVRVLEGDDTEVAEWLATGAADAAILIDPEPTADQVVVARDEFQAVTRADHPLAGTGSVALGDLIIDPLLVSASGCEPQVRELHKRAALRYHPTQRVRDLSTLLAMVDAGLGVTVMPSLAAPMLPSTLTMTPLSETLTRTLALSGPTTRPRHPLVDTVLELTPGSPDGTGGATWRGASEPRDGIVIG